MIHSLALIATSLAPRNNRLAGNLFLGGIILFSGRFVTTYLIFTIESLYALVLSENKKLGMITPFGGVMFIAGWLGLLFAF